MKDLLNEITSAVRGLNDNLAPYNAEIVQIIHKPVSGLSIPEKIAFAKLIVRVAAEKQKEIDELVELLNCAEPRPAG